MASPERLLINGCQAWGGLGGGLQVRAGTQDDKRPFPMTPMGWGKLGATCSLVFTAVSLGRILYWCSCGQGDGSHSLSSKGSRMRAGNSDSQQMESSVRSGHVEEGAANSAGE